MYNRNSFILALGFHIVILSCALIYKTSVPIEIDTNQVELWDEESLQINEIQKYSKLSLPSNTNKINKDDKLAKEPKLLKPIQNIIEAPPKIKNIPTTHNIITNKVTEKSAANTKINDEKVDIIHNKKHINKKEELISKQVLPLSNRKQVSENSAKSNIVEKKKKEKIERLESSIKQPTKPVEKVAEKKSEPQKKLVPVLTKPQENTKNNAEEIRKANLARLIQNSNKENLPLANTVNNSNIHTNSINQNKTNNLNNNSNTNSTGLSSAYKSKIQSIIKRHIRYNGDSGNTAVISLRIDAKGNILFKNLVKSSGNILWDNSTLKAIEDAEPFPQPENAETTTMTLRITAD